MDGNKPILAIAHGHMPISGTTIVVQAALVAYLEFLVMFTGSVQQITTLSGSPVDVASLRRRNVITAVSIQFPVSHLQPHCLLLKPLPVWVASHPAYTE